MDSENEHGGWRIRLSGLLRWGIGIALLTVVMGIVLSNYSASIYLVLGASILLGLGIIYRLWGAKNILIAGFIVLISIMVLMRTVTTLPFLPSTRCIPNETKHTKVVDQYQADVEVVNFSEGTFRLTGHIIYSEFDSTCSEQEYWVNTNTHEGIEEDLGSKTMESVAKGLFIRELIIPVEITGMACCGRETINTIVVKELPYESFYDAQFIDKVQIDEYLGTETVRLEVNQLPEKIRLAYLPAPFYNLRILVEPFIQLSKYDNLALAELGFVVSSIFFLFIKPKVISFISEKVSKIIKKDKVFIQRKSPKKRINRNQ